jgi:hypothetical protein
MASSPRFSSRLASSLLAGLMMLGICMLPASATSVLEAEKLLRLKQPRQALEQIEIFLARNPNDPQGRFFKGLILTELNRMPEAISMFQKLTEDYPELPEPYNNLAVLYAQQKQYDKAKTALEMAIRTHPSYAVAHENLGDIYARMATQAYDRALQLDSSNTAAQSKLNLIREMVGNSSAKGSRPAGASVTAAACVGGTATLCHARFARCRHGRLGEACSRGQTGRRPCRIGRRTRANTRPGTGAGSDAGPVCRHCGQCRDRRRRRRRHQAHGERLGCSLGAQGREGLPEPLRRRLRGAWRKATQGMGNRTAVTHCQAGRHRRARRECPDQGGWQGSRPGQLPAALSRSIPEKQHQQDTGPGAPR